MKILFLIDSLGSGGAQRQMTNIACLLKRRGYKVSFLVYSKSDFFKQCLKNNNIPIKTITTTNLISRIFHIRRFIRKGKYNAVISFMNTPNFLNCFAAVGGHNWKIITSERSSNISIFKNKKNKIFNWFQRYSDTIVCNSENAKNMWLKYHPKYANKIKVIYNTVKLSKITSSYLPLKNGKLHLLIAASYQGLKNPVNLVKAINLLNDEEKNKLKVDWYGRKNTDCINTTKIYDKTLQLIYKYHLDGIITLHNETSNIHNRMNTADVIGLFSKYEGFPNVVCEAMSIGKPIIMTKVSDYYLFVDKLNGLICDTTDPEAIVKGIKHLLKISADDIIKMGKDSQQKASNLFNSEKIIDQWLNQIDNSQ